MHVRFSTCLQTVSGSSLRQEDQLSSYQVQAVGDGADVGVGVRTVVVRGVV